VQKVTEPISEVLRKLGVRSLREAIGEPSHVLGHGDIKDASDKLLERLEALRTPRFRGTLLKRLEDLGLTSDLVWHDWYDRISRVTRIRFATDVEATYSFYRHQYTTPADAGFDPTSGTFWVKEGRQDAISRFCETVAAQLVFKSTARPVHLLALERALDLEIHDPSFGRPEFSASGMEEDKESEKNDGIDPEPSEAVFGHSPFRPDPSRNIPKSEPISSSISPSSKSGAAPLNTLVRSGTNTLGTDRGPTPEIEKEHIENLKRLQYASHCQMCLCERSPGELAPTGSYIQWEEVRRRVVEAHHVDPKSGMGARHAGNLILLCKLHHDNYGRRLTRETVTGALQHKTLEKTVRFESDDGPISDLNGRAIKVKIPDTGDVVSIFFTHEHAQFWLSRITLAEKSRVRSSNR